MYLNGSHYRSRNLLFYYLSNFILHGEIVQRSLLSVIIARGHSLITGLFKPYVKINARRTIQYDVHVDSLRYQIKSKQLKSGNMSLNCTVHIIQRNTYWCISWPQCSKSDAITTVFIVFILYCCICSILHFWRSNKIILNYE